MSRMYEEQTLIEDLRRLMKERKTSLRALSSAIDVPYRSMQNYLSGENKIPAIILIRILDYLGSDLRYLRSGDNLLRHADIYDAIWQCLGDQLLSIDLDNLGINKIIGYEENEKHRQKMKAAYYLAIQISKLYDKNTKDHATYSPMPTIKEIEERRARAAALRDDASDLADDDPPTGPRV